MPFRAVQTIFVSIAVNLVLGSAQGAVHLMQIEQVIGGVNGDPTAQAVQLRMRQGGQVFTSFARLVVVDATGSNPVTLIEMNDDVGNGSGGARILVASASFVTSPAVTPDFIMTNTIPESYLAAGSLVFADDFGQVYWRVCWGGSAYTGPTDVDELINDGNGDVAPPFADELPSTTLQSLRFPGPANAGSTNNAADYALSTRGAVFVNNDNQSGTVVAPPQPCPGDIIDDGAVNVADLLAVITAWGPCVDCPATACPPDIVPSSGDCSVNVADLLYVITSWGACP